MIREDRIQLNNRFIKVFNLLKEKGDIILNDRNGKGIGDFADKVLGNKAYGHIVRAFLNPKDKRVIDYRQARIVCREYGVNESYLIDGIGTPFGFEIPKPRKSAESGRAFIPQGNIMYTSTQAFAGSGESAADMASEDNYFFSIPNLSGNGLVAFPIEGRSMEPVIMDGDMLICRELSGLSEVKENQIYAVKANGSMWVKYVKKVENSRGKITKLKLISANNLEYDAFDADVDENTRLYKVVRRISEVN